MPYIRKTKPIDTIALYNAFNDDELRAVFGSIRELAEWLGRPVASVKSTISQIEAGKNNHLRVSEKIGDVVKVFIYR